MSQEINIRGDIFAFASDTVTGIKNEWKLALTYYHVRESFIYIEYVFTHVSLGLDSHIDGAQIRINGITIEWKEDFHFFIKPNIIMNKGDVLEVYLRDFESSEKKGYAVVFGTELKEKKYIDFSFFLNMKLNELGDPFSISSDLKTVTSNYTLFFEHTVPEDKVFLLQRLAPYVTNNNNYGFFLLNYTGKRVEGWGAYVYFADFSKVFNPGESFSVSLKKRGGSDQTGIFNVFGRQIKLSDFRKYQEEYQNNFNLVDSFMSSDKDLSVFIAKCKKDNSLWNKIKNRIEGLIGIDLDRDGEVGEVGEVEEIEK